MGGLGTIFILMIIIAIAERIKVWHGEINYVADSSSINFWLRFADEESVKNKVNQAHEVIDRRKQEGIIPDGESWRFWEHIREWKQEMWFKSQQRQSDVRNNRLRLGYDEAYKKDEIYTHIWERNERTTLFDWNEDLVAKWWDIETEKIKKKNEEIKREIESYTFT